MQVTRKTNLCCQEEGLCRFDVEDIRVVQVPARLGQFALRPKQTLDRLPAHL